MCPLSTAMSPNNLLFFLLFFFYFCMKIHFFFQQQKLNKNVYIQTWVPLLFTNFNTQHRTHLNEWMYVCVRVSLAHSVSDIEIYWACVVCCLVFRFWSMALSTAAILMLATTHVSSIYFILWNLSVSMPCHINFTAIPVTEYVSTPTYRKRSPCFHIIYIHILSAIQCRALVYYQRKSSHANCLIYVL